jgi:hypothetical protein
MPSTIDWRKFAILLTMLFALALGSAATVRADSFLVVGNSNPTGAQAILNIISLNNGQLVFSVQNISESSVTGFGFDLINGDFTSNHSSGLDGFLGANAGDFTFHDDALRNVPQFKDAVLDFGFTTGPSGKFNGGHPPDGLGNGQTSTVFTINGDFTGFTQQQIANAVFIRFQSVKVGCQHKEDREHGEDGDDEDDDDDDCSDVGHGGTAVVTEPTGMVLFGTGLLGMAAGVRYWRKKG